LIACFFLNFRLSRGVIIALLMRSKNQNAYPLSMPHAEAGLFGD
jgi:hypothetical protein